MKILLKFVVVLFLLLQTAGFALAVGQVEPVSPVLVDFCAFSKETDTDMNITIREDGAISGEFFMTDCGSGPLFGYAQIDTDSEGAWNGRLFIYTDILGGCLEAGAFYSVDVPDLLYRWQAGADKNGAGLLELLECGL
ncbi:MAG: hypothetical protein IME98_01280 [Proteobacteria bacterium]|nr:hypothetical protein [Pseudomonadota bacterium]